MTDRPPPRERNITPYALFDSRPKIAAAQPTRAPVEPFEGLPSIPRGPRMPTGFGELPHALGAQRDTDPAELQDAELGDNDQTPTDPESPTEMILRKLTKLEREVRDSKTSNGRIYDLLVKIHAEQQADKRERRAIKRRLLAVELRDRWLPWVAIALSALALLRTFR